MTRKTNKAGIALIKKHEGCDLLAYLCPAKKWTIGYGHTGKDVTAGMTITQAEAERILIDDLSYFEFVVSHNVKAPLTDNQFAALVSLVFNIGDGNFVKSTLLKKLNIGDYTGAAAEFPKWNRGGGKILAGLVKRRNDERKLFEV